MEKILRCAIYIRVSTWEQAAYGKSLRAQKECLEEYASNHGMKVVGIFADEGQTARKELKKRKAIHALLAEVKQDKIDVILFWRMDRWFRSVGDFYKVQDVLDAHGTRWIDVGEPNINMETRDGRLSLNLALAIGQNEVDTTSERIKFTVNNTIKNGGLVWGKNNLGLGYKIEEVDGKNQIVKDPETAPMVEEFYRYIFLHQNKCATVKYMQETFGIPFSYTMPVSIETTKIIVLPILPGSSCRSSRRSAEIMSVQRHPEGYIFLPVSCVVRCAARNLREPARNPS